MSVNYLFMNAADETRLSFERLEEVLSHKGVDMVEFRNHFNLYKQKLKNWKIRGVPDSKLVEISKYIDVPIEQLISFSAAEHRPDRQKYRDLIESVDDEKLKIFDRLLELSFLGWEWVDIGLRMGMEAAVLMKEKNLKKQSKAATHKTKPQSP